MSSTGTIIDRCFEDEPNSLLRTSLYWPNILSGAADEEGKFSWSALGIMTWLSACLDFESLTFRFEYCNSTTQKAIKMMFVPMEDQLDGLRCEEDAWSSMVSKISHAQNLFRRILRKMQINHIPHESLRMADQSEPAFLEVTAARRFWKNWESKKLAIGFDIYWLLDAIFFFGVNPLFYSGYTTLSRK